MNLRITKMAATLALRIADERLSNGADDFRPSADPVPHGGRIMYLECKAGELEGEARIGRVSFSKSGRTLYYRGQRFRSLKGAGFKSNYYDVDSGDDYWISGPKRRGGDRLYGGSSPVEIDEDVRVEYWTEIRRHPERIESRLA